MTGPLTARFCESLRGHGGFATTTSRSGLLEALLNLVRDDELILIAPELKELGPHMVEGGCEILLAESESPGGEIGSSSIHLQAEVAAEAFRRASASITSAAMGIAASGSIALPGGGDYRGMLSSLPPHHIAVLEDRAIVETLQDGLSKLFAEFSSHQSRFALVTGPSRTADIEMTSIVGVHGPLRLDVVVIEGGS